jgi:hypothetical protein
LPIDNDTVYNSYVFIVKVADMFKVTIHDTQKMTRANDLNKTPSKHRDLITRSPVKTRRDCSPAYSKSPMSKKQSRQTIPAQTYNPPYVPIGYLKDRSPIK